MARVSIRSYGEFQDYWNEELSGAFPAGVHLLYRGHAKPDYQNRPTLLRDGLSLEEALQYEQLIHKYFLQSINCHGFIGGTKLRPNKANSTYINIWRYLAQERHLGLPSRLLDWSMNWRVALYFAVNNPCHHEFDGHIWVLPSFTHWTESENELFKQIRSRFLHISASNEDEAIIDTHDPFNPDMMILLHYSHYRPDMFPQHAEDRRSIQGGKFITYENNRLLSPLEKHRIGKLMWQVSIPADAKPDILREFYSKGITDDFVVPPLPVKTIKVLENIKSRALHDLYEPNKKGCFPSWLSFIKQ